MTQTIGFLGLGTMGQAMVVNLLEQGLNLHIWNRSTDKAQDLINRGAVWAETPAELAKNCDIILMCLTDAAAVEAVHFGANGITSAIGAKTTTVIDFSTIGPDHARNIADRLGTIAYLDAPVSGGPIAAAQGELVIFVGGDESIYNTHKSLFAQVSRQVTYMGPSGSGQMTKVCNQLIVGVNTVAISEAIRLAKAAGIDAERLPAALAGGFADSSPLQLFGPRMVSGETEPPLGKLGLMLKDLRLVQAKARDHDVTAPVLARTLEVFESAATQEHLGWDAEITRIIDEQLPTIQHSTDPELVEVENPYDPNKRNDLSPNEAALLKFMSDCMHGDDLSLIDTMMAEDYIQHTPGIGQGRDGVRNYIEQIARKRPGRKNWRAIQIFECGDIVVLHKLLPHVIIADFMRFNEQGEMAEHWDVVQPLPETGYDPMRVSQENLTRFKSLFSMTEAPKKA